MQDYTSEYSLFNEAQNNSCYNVEAISFILVIKDVSKSHIHHFFFFLIFFLEGGKGHLQVYTEGVYVGGSLGG